MSVKEVLDSEVFKGILASMIREYKYRERPAMVGYDLRRTPYDNLEDRGIFTPEKLVEEFALIDRGISKLPSSQRKAVAIIVLDAAKKAHRVLEPEFYETGAFRKDPRGIAP